jgi:hypothetical protein
MKNEGNGHLGITKGNETFQLIKTYKYFQIKTNQTERNMKFRKMFYRRYKVKRHQTTALTSQNVQQKSTNRVNFIGGVRLCCFPLASIKCLETSQ